MRTVFLYGIGGANDHFRVIRYVRIDGDEICIETFKYEASVMRMRYPGIKRVFAIDNRPGLRRSYMDTIKKNSIESCVIFRDLLERSGIEID